MYQAIRYEVKDGIATITFHRPERFNAFTEQMHRELLDAFVTAGKEQEVRCIVLTGAGKAFNAGQDLTEAKQREEIDFTDILRKRYNPLVIQIRRTEKPVIAAVNGAAAGAGMSIALACDIRLASEQATFVNAFVNIGLVPDAGGCYFLPRIVGIGKALELAMTGSRISAEEAMRIGLVNQVFPAETFREEVTAYARKLAHLPPKAVGLIKQAMYKSLHMSLEETLEYEAYIQQIAGHTEDHKEGVRAFLEKRPPVFKGE
jgi:2-(1,2-epoxy-1,2-dihydrophenyl)acetyl-CoA isomerase